MERTAAEKERLLKKLRRIEGQVRGIQNMIAEDRYCIDVLMQVQAARAALNNIGQDILEAHAKGCVVEAVKRGNAEIVDEMLAAVKQFIR